MNVYLIGLDLPVSIKHQIKKFCYGLSSVEWLEEENFHILVRHLGPLQEEAIKDIQKALSHMSFMPFSLRLKTLFYAHMEIEYCGKLEWFKLTDWHHHNVLTLTFINASII